MPTIPYYKYPLDLPALMKGKDAATLDLGGSISKNIELILMTRFGELRSDPTFGCEIWDIDFELIVSHGYWEKQMCNSILQSIQRHETRLNDIEVTVVLSEVEKTNLALNYPEIRKKVDIKLKGKVKKTGERFDFNAGLFLSPLSLD